MNSEKIGFKKCTRCNRLLPLDNFEKYSGERGRMEVKSSRSSQCKECRGELRLINLYKKKYKIINEIFNGKCGECETEIDYLPCFEFHHPYPDLKTTTWTHIKHNSLSNIKKWIKREKVVLLCSNCHELKKAKFFIDFKSLILREDLFQYSPEEIDQFINQSINKHPNLVLFKEYKRNIKIQIKQYIRKRFVFDQLFYGMCIGCGKVSKFDYLPSLELHHKTPESIKSKSTWRDFANMDCISIINKIIEEDCICLCSNCHIFIRSKIYLFLNEVIDDDHLKELLRNNYEMIRSNILKYRYSINDIDFKAPLKLKFSQEDFWKIRLIQIEIFIERNSRNYFKILDLAKLMNRKPRSVLDSLKRLVSLGYLNKFQETSFPFTNYYELSESGKEKVVNLKEIHHEIYIKLENDIGNMEDYMNRQNRWIN